MALCNKTQRKMAIIILAWNEETIIKKTVNQILQSLRPSDSLFVIADNCKDNTARIAEKAGAQVFIRETKTSDGKGDALSWFVKNHQAQINDYDFLVILDSDSEINIDFLDKLDAALSSSIKVAQCLLFPINHEKSPLSTLIALSDLVEQNIFDRLKSFFGLSVRLRGTGMIFTPDILVDICPKIRTQVEDIALSLLVNEKKIRIYLLRSCIVFDPKPHNRAAASRQRARWFHGQWKAFWVFRLTIFKVLLQGPSHWILVGSLFLKPRWLNIASMILLGFIFFKLPIISFILFFLVGTEILLLLIGVFTLQDKVLFLKSFLRLPEFIFMWLKGILLSFKDRGWLRGR